MEFFGKFIALYLILIIFAGLVGGFAIDVQYHLKASEKWALWLFVTLLWPVALLTFVFYGLVVFYRLSMRTLKVNKI